VRAGESVGARDVGAGAGAQLTAAKKTPITTRILQAIA
jgi:hypothetical protein